MGGNPIYRNGFITDQGNQILDVKDLDISEPKELEIYINNIPGVVDNGIFAFNKPGLVLVSD
jgi:ribose 5-phosphate isomerase A